MVALIVRYGSVTVELSGVFCEESSNSCSDDRSCDVGRLSEQTIEGVVEHVSAGLVRGVGRGLGFRPDVGNVGVFDGATIGGGASPGGDCTRCCASKIFGGRWDLGIRGCAERVDEETKDGVSSCDGKVDANLPSPDVGRRDASGSSLGVGHTDGGLGTSGDGTTRVQLEPDGGFQRLGCGVDGSTLVGDGSRGDCQFKKSRKGLRKKKNKKKDLRCDGIGGFQSATPARYVAGLINADSDSELKDSVKRKWVIKNQLEIAKAERELAILKGGDVEEDVRKKNIVTRAAIERNIVAIEKCHASLRGADTHTIDDEARVTTVLSGVKSDTISPDSSASRLDYKKALLELRDKDKAIEKLTEKLRQVGVDVTGVEDVAKSEWTVDVGGQVTMENQLKFSDYGYSWTTGFNEPRLCDDGKERVRVDFFD